MNQESASVPATVETAAAVAQSKQPAPPDAVRLDLAAHNVVHIVNKDAVLEGELRCAAGVLVFGRVRGRIVCAEGSVILAEGSDFAGKISAPNIFVAGTVRDLKRGEISELRGELSVRVSENAAGRARILSRVHEVHGRFSGEICQLDPVT